MKLWDKGLKIDSLIEEFTTAEDRKLDLLLAKYDVEGSVAHIRMLHKIGYLTKEELSALTRELSHISKVIDEGKFEIEDGVEDVHSQVELLLTKSLGDVGKKIHLGRSRNDQVLVDLRLFLRDVLSEMKEDLLDLGAILLDLSNQYKEVLMPGYTHMQIAMVSSYGMWFGAYAEALIEDAEYAKNIRQQINKNPLGTAAGYGSSIPLDRELTTLELNFSDICVNPIYAQIARGKTELLVSNVISQAAYSMGKMAMDICQYSGQNFGFMKLSGEFTTGSSIMPHKKNPDVFELVRAQCNLLTTLPQQIQSVINNLPSGYHRDFQLLKEILFPAIQRLKSIFSIITHALPKLEIIPPNLTEEKYKYLYTVESVNELVKSGMPFRDAYKKVGEMVENGTFEPSMELDHTHIGSIGNLGNDILRKRLESLKKE